MKTRKKAGFLNDFTRLARLRAFDQPPLMQHQDPIHPSPRRSEAKPQKIDSAR